MCFVWIWEQTAIISLYSINWLVFITASVYRAVRTEWSIQFRSLSLSLSLCRTALDEVTGRPVAAKARIPSQFGPCETRVRPSVNGHDFSPGTSVYPCQYYSTSSTYSFLSTRCSNHTDELAKPEDLPKCEALSAIGHHWIKTCFHLFC